MTRTTTELIGRPWGGSPRVAVAATFTGMRYGQAPLRANPKPRVSEGVARNQRASEQHGEQS